METRTASGYGAGAGVLLTDDHAAADDDGRAGTRTAVATERRTGYTRDYSPVLLTGADALADGDVARVVIEALDPATGVLTARVR